MRHMRIYISHFVYGLKKNKKKEKELLDIDLKKIFINRHEVKFNHFLFYFLLYFYLSKEFQ